MNIFGEKQNFIYLSVFLGYSAYRNFQGKLSPTALKMHTVAMALTPLCQAFICSPMKEYEYDESTCGRALYTMLPWVACEALFLYTNTTLKTAALSTAVLGLAQWGLAREILDKEAPYTPDETTLEPKELKSPLKDEAFETNPKSFVYGSLFTFAVVTILDTLNPTPLDFKIRALFFGISTGALYRFEGKEKSSTYYEILPSALSLALFGYSQTATTALLCISQSLLASNYLLDPFPEYTAFARKSKMYSFKLYEADIKQAQKLFNDPRIRMVSEGVYDSRAVILRSFLSDQIKEEINSGDRLNFTENDLKALEHGFGSLFVLIQRHRMGGNVYSELERFFLNKQTQQEQEWALTRFGSSQILEGLDIVMSRGSESTLTCDSIQLWHQTLDSNRFGIRWTDFPLLYRIKTYFSKEHALKNLDDTKLLQSYTAILDASSNLIESDPFAEGLQNGFFSFKNMKQQLYPQDYWDTLDQIRSKNLVPYVTTLLSKIPNQYYSDSYRSVSLDKLYRRFKTSHKQNVAEWKRFVEEQTRKANEEFVSRALGYF